VIKPKLDPICQALVVSLLVLAGCGGGREGATTREQTAAKLPFRAVLRAPTHRPRAGEPWRYSVRVTDLSGRPIAARIRMQVLFGGIPVGEVDGGRTFRFVGVWREPRDSPVLWPPQASGRPLVFEAIVTARGRTARLRYPVRVR
jgi:hypothetical protein